MPQNRLSELLGYGRDFAQGASNAFASNVSAPVDGLAWLLRKAGVPMPSNPVGGSDWLAQQGLMAEPQNKLAGLLGEAAGMSGPMAAAAKAPQIARGLLQGADNLAAPRTLNPQTGAVVWHGSPHKFDKFDSSKIGTGEGAQAYGHGLYVAESKDVAGQYADNVRAVSPLAIKDAKSELLSMEKELANYGGGSRVKQSEIEAKKAYIQKLVDRSDSKSIYKVDLPDEHIAKMLDWDNGGSSVWANAVNKYGSESAASTALRKQGIPGIRYLDGGSRGAGTGSSNYVVFPGNESLLSILERNGGPLK